VLSAMELGRKAVNPEAIKPRDARHELHQIHHGEMENQFDWNEP